MYLAIDNALAACNIAIIDILILGFDDGMVSIYNNPDVKMKNSAVRLKLKLSNTKDKRIKFFMHANPQDLVDKHLFLCKLPYTISTYLLIHH